jgi:hypothetical protein
VCFWGLVMIVFLEMEFDYDWAVLELVLAVVI